MFFFAFVVVVVARGTAAVFIFIQPQTEKSEALNKLCCIQLFFFFFIKFNGKMWAKGTFIFVWAQRATECGVRRYNIDADKQKKSLVLGVTKKIA